MPTIKVNDININYDIKGTASSSSSSPVVFIGGLGDDISLWSFQVDALGEHFKILLFDNRGVGGTDKPLGPYTTKQMASDTYGLMIALGINRAHIVGSSMGGMIAMELAIAYPQVIDKLILCCTSSEPSPANLRLYDFWQTAAPNIGLPQLMKEIFLWCLTPDFFTEQAKLAEEIDRSLTTMILPVESFLSQLNSIQMHNATARLKQITAPTLVLTGPNDLIFPLKQSKQICAEIPGSQIVVTAHGGHAFMWEAADEFNKALLIFLLA